VEISSLFDNVDGYTVKEFIEAENRMHPLNIFNARSARACINRRIQILTIKLYG
jgi:hypothetical protein